ncbi:hypothetical protein [Streptomyces sp. NPDC005930]|uniref:hypothetical protein n=1 Tax=Streptomyces sp. NPDC005930 TaxID=3364736 RepID=UPI003689D53D
MSFGEIIKVHPFNNAAAWDHRSTRWAWVAHVALIVTGLVGWIALWVVLLQVSLWTPNWVVWVFMPYFIYGPYRAVVQLKYFPAAFLMLRILRAYPWRIVRDAPRGLTRRPEVVSKQYGWFEFPNPSRPEQWLALVFPSHLRRRWWSRRMSPLAKRSLQEEIETIWFAGDPRFIGIISAPPRWGAVPRRLRVVEQRTDARSGTRFVDWGATPDDIERGQRAGVYPANP